MSIFIPRGTKIRQISLGIFFYALPVISDKDFTNFILPKLNILTKNGGYKDYGLKTVDRYEVEISDGHSHYESFSYEGIVWLIEGTGARLSTKLLGELNLCIPGV